MEALPWVTTPISLAPAVVGGAVVFMLVAFRMGVTSYRLGTKVFWFFIWLLLWTGISFYVTLYL